MSGPKYLDPEDLALFAMQLLPPEEVAPVLTHLEHNPSARQELAEIQGVLAGVAFTADMHTPPALARTQFLKRIAREQQPGGVRSAAAARETAKPAAAVADVASIEGYHRGEKGEKVAGFATEPVKPGLVMQLMPWTGWAVAALLAVMAASLYREREGLKSSVASTEAQLAKTAADATTAKEVMNAMTDTAAMKVTLTRQGALLSPTGRTVYSADKGVLIFSATNMEPIESYKVYELWLIPQDGSAPIPAGTFHPDSHGYASMISTTMPKGVDAKAFGITIEDDGGSKVPTPPILMTGA